MKTKYKHIHFENKPKSDAWICRNNRRGKYGAILGDVILYGIWQTYCFFPTERVAIALSSDCLRDIADFLEQLNKERGKDEKKS